MLICSFLANNALYDMKVHGRLVEVIERIVEENDEVDFWLYRLSGNFRDEPDFYTTYYDAVAEVKKRRPDKHILLTQIERHKDREYDTEFMRGSIPSCLADRVIAPPTSPKGQTCGILQPYPKRSSVGS